MLMDEYTFSCFQAELMIVTFSQAVESRLVNLLRVGAKAGQRKRTPFLAKATMDRMAKCMRRDGQEMATDRKRWKFDVETHLQGPRSSHANFRMGWRVTSNGHSARC
uniref:Uncharacterized protein n=1 Tax=Rhodosorus marinus TaxID=101924 RepID=A0A7S3EE95_9RHOD